MNKKIEPPRPRNELRLKQEANANLVQIENLDYVLENLIQTKKKKIDNTESSTDIPSTTISSQQTTSSSNTITNAITDNSTKITTSETQNQITSTIKTKNNVDNEKKINKLANDEAPSTKEKETKNNGKKNKINEEELTDTGSKKIKIENKKTENKKPKRKKVFQACVVCRKSHISCDNKRPCTRCVKKGIAHLCHDAPKKGSNMMDCNSCPIFPLLKGPYPIQTNIYKPPTFPNYSTSILNSQLNPSPLTNFPIPLLNQKVNTFSYPRLNDSSGLVKQQIINQKQVSPLNNSFDHLLKQVINNQQNLQSPQITSTAISTPSHTQQPTPPLSIPLTSVNSLTPNINNTTLKSTYPLSTSTLSNNLMSPINTISDSTIQNSLETLQKNIQTIQTPQFNSISQKSQISKDSTHITSASEVSSTSSFNTTTEENASINNMLDQIASPHYALPELEFNPSKPCVPFSSVTPIFSSDYINNELSALVNFCQNVSHENGMPSRCKNCPFSRNEQFLLKAADNFNPNMSIEDQLKEIIKEKYKAGLLKPYNYSKGYIRLQKYLDENISILNKQKILNAFNTYQKGFKNAASNITDWDLLSSEESFERLLLEYDSVFASVGIPSCLWRRTGEIFKANRHFAYLVGVPIEQLNNGKMSIYEFMTEDFVANYWEKYSIVAFDSKQKAVITSCVLENPQSFKRSIKCAFSFTVRRDKFEIPSAVIGNFMPYNPQLIYKDPFATNGLGLLGFLSPYSTPSYRPLPRGETGYKGCGCSNTQCCSTLKKELKPESNFTYNYNDNDHQHDSTEEDSYHEGDHEFDECHHHDHNNDCNHNYCNNSYTQNYTNKTTSQIEVNSSCPNESIKNSYCSQCERNEYCARNNPSCNTENTSCDKQCSCNESNTNHFYNSENTSKTEISVNTAVPTTNVTNNPIMNEFMNLDMNQIYPSSKTPVSTVPLMLMNNKTLNATTNNTYTNLSTTINPLMNFTAPLQTSENTLSSINEYFNTSIIQDNIQTKPQSQDEEQQIQQQQLQQLQQELRNKISNQNKDNNLPSLPENDIRNELSDDLLFSILNSKE
ncbi:hypothetical protein BCR36DRAFT_415585 [Piromyces finnis]|uniref:Zn(2)-C6 fungal-type domain-containing protein n=1 Tax=Piromyces finnis TaxID=1754191 RepID=A0A1Y1UYD8_9FUNG|nr:hypothetical protein BCR36DRAFT_415585 [Piromyces finnis]|eukprot:ORX43405.1 hypothetical protein BCR36DRAFT_415585 [Piromyces finnis]